ncbi:MAG: methionine synthase [Planctomycetes bacterium]|nr:methionine synthase [Planctomycetota bacterium]MCP4771842.1 methionine synthase [Planctomycetota bacterium]
MSHKAPQRPSLADSLLERILVLDGAMGTMVQAHGLDEEDYRGERFKDHPLSLKGNHDVLVLTRPDVIASVHDAYLQAGADVIETCSFCATSIGQTDYGLEDQCYDLNRAAAEVARASADAFTAKDPSKPRYVAGSMGPTNRMCSMSADVEDPGARATDFDSMREAYLTQAQGLYDGGVDCLLVETIFDTLNAKAALFAIEQLFEDRGARIPVLISGTITDASGRTLSGQTVEAFWTSVSHLPLLAVGFNCALGPEEMLPHIEDVAELADCHVLCYPNAGLPNEMGGYDLEPAPMAEYARDLAQRGLVNIVGGCCGTTPAHIQAMSEAVQGCTPRVAPKVPPMASFSGLERLELREDSLFTNIGERTNVTGSRRFARLILEDDFDTALAIARQQVENGAQIIDVNMDEGLLDSQAAMQKFLRLIASEPDIARVPIMIDSSRWEVMEEGLKNCQGHAIVNSLSLKEGESEFRKYARLVRRYGAAVVVMAFDEQGQAVDVDRRLEICTRAVGILRDEGFRDQDIILDLNVLAIATGLSEHDGYAASFLEALQLLKNKFPLVSFSGGISNLSFSFRGAERIREALHTVFLYHAVKVGLDMGIVNAGRLPLYDDLDPRLRDCCEDLILARRSEAAEDLLEMAKDFLAEGDGGAQQAAEAAWRSEDAAARLGHAIIHGVGDYLEEDLPEALQECGLPLAVIEGPLMDGMGVVGERFGSGRMFLPQVVKSARVMKRAVAWLEPHLEAAKQQVNAGNSQPKVLLATVKGDVHDIGKNIVGVILACNGFEVIDLGVMVPAKTILETAADQDVDIIGLSGLITPSLDEMVHVAKELERCGSQKPLLIGGATTSLAHSALRIAPQFSGSTVHATDASRAAQAVQALTSTTQREDFLQRNAAKQVEAGERHQKRNQKSSLLPIAAARKRAEFLDWQRAELPLPSKPGLHVLKDYPLDQLVANIDWSPFFSTWELKGRYPAILEDKTYGAQATELFADAQALLKRILNEKLFTARAAFAIHEANTDGDDIVVYPVDSGNGTSASHRLPMLRQQREGRNGSFNRCLSDFIAPVHGGVRDHLGMFVVSAGFGAAELAAKFDAEHDDYHSIMAKALADRLAEAFAEHLHHRVRTEYWAYAENETGDNEARIRELYRGIRPAPGYPACPDHSLKDDIFKILNAEQRIGVSLTESRAMMPAASVSGFYFANPEASYFGLGTIATDQVEDYARRREISIEEAQTRLAPNMQD